MDLFSSTNKTGQDQPKQIDIASPEYKDKLADEKILELTRKWKEAYSGYIKDIEKQATTNENYWLGKQYSQLELGTTAERPLVDNLIFEALEIFLPIATRANPEPLVASDNSPQGQELADQVRKVLSYQADKQKLRMKLKKMTRQWALSFLGTIKVIWNVDTNDIETRVLRTEKLILDPHAYIEEGGIYTGDYIGEKKRATGRKLKRMFEGKSEPILKACDGNLDKIINYTEWWTPNDLFFTLDNNEAVLFKTKNINWNYDGEVETTDLETGEVKKVETKGRNHFDVPRMPYIFLSVFSTNKQPHDETSLIYQNLPIQDLINKRYKQIDQNVSSQNNGIVLSGEHFTKEQAAEAVTQLSRGGGLWVPDGDVNAAYKRDQAPALAADVFRNLMDARQELRNIFGTSGATPQNIQNEQTARGKILINQLDTSRIGGGVTEYIEQVADSIYNYWLQMMYVHYTDVHYASAVGEVGAQEIISIRNVDLNLPLSVTVKEGSLIPKDPLIQRNEAVDLWSANAIDPITLFKRLDFPNPQESAKQLLMWQFIIKGALPPQMMFPDWGQPTQAGTQLPQQGVGGPAVNPPTGQEVGQAPQQGVPEAPQIQSQQLMQAIPIR